MYSDRAWLIDASIYIFRAWFSLPDQWHSRDGRPLSAVYGYTRFLLEFIEQTGNAFYGAAAFDESLGSNYRNDIYPAKSGKEQGQIESALAECWELVEELFTTAPVKAA